MHTTGDGVIIVYFSSHVPTTLCGQHRPTVRFNILFTVSQCNPARIMERSGLDVSGDDVRFAELKHLQFVAFRFAPPHDVRRVCLTIALPGWDFVGHDRITHWLARPKDEGFPDNDKVY